MFYVYSYDSTPKIIESDHNDAVNSSLIALSNEIRDTNSEFISSLPDDFDNTLALDVAKTISCDEKWLKRILIARKCKIEASLKLYREEVYWRTKWRPSEIKIDQIRLAIDSGAWRICGFTRDGAPICNYKLKHWNPDDYGLDVYVRYVAFMLELLTSKFGTDVDAPSQFVFLFDLEGFSMSLIRKNVREMIERLVYVAQSQYPERLGSVYLLNTPRGFSTAWVLISTLLDAKTASKVFFLSPNKTGSFASQLDEKANICPTTLSIDYGGQHNEYPLPM